MQVKGRTLLFVEPNREYAKQLQEYFAPQNTVIIADCLLTAEECLRLLNFDMVVLDILLRDGSGLNVFEIFKELPPTIVYSSLDNEEAMLESFYLGAADYVIKPCSFKLLEARMYLRLQPVRKSEKTFGLLKINPVSRSVFYNGKQLPFTSSEFNILYYLSTHAGEFYSANDLYENIWQAQSLNTATVRKHISSMRRKLLDATGGKDYILTDFGKGYAFTEDYE
ncbi:MAG: response regulator transcription factor [Clostridia bacterium]|nr:response regulator transcription factor [Clostridia bacterium]